MGNKKMSNMPIIGFDLGGTKMMVVVLDQDMKILSTTKKKTQGDSGKKLGPERIAEVIRIALVEAGFDEKSPVGGIGVGAPGMLNLSKGEIIKAPNLGWSNVALGEYLKKEFKCPVAICNDVDAGTFGEYSLGSAKGSRCAFGVFPGTGIGAGCVYEGKLFQGKTQSCMELGHFPIVPNGALCGCGKRGCLETVASRLAISSAATVAVYRGEAPNLAQIAGTDLSKIRSKALAQSIKAGDRAIEAIVVQAASWLGRTIGGVVNLILPDTIILGGGLVEAMPDIYKTNIEKGIQETVMDSYKDEYRVVISKFQDNAVAIGAAAWMKVNSK